MAIDNIYWIQKKYAQNRNVKPLKNINEFMDEHDTQDQNDGQNKSFHDAFSEYLDELENK